MSRHTDEEIERTRAAVIEAREQALQAKADAVRIKARNKADNIRRKAETKAKLTIAKGEARAPGSKASPPPRWSARSGWTCTAVRSRPCADGSIWWRRRFHWRRASC